MFDAVCASHSLHHIRDLDHALDRIASLLGPGGLLVLDEHGWDLADEATLDWLWNQRRALASAGHGETPPSLEAFREEWQAEHLGLHGFEAMRDELSQALRGARVRPHAVPLPARSGASLRRCSSRR